MYHDRHNKQSQPLPVQVRVGVPKTPTALKHATKRIATSFSSLDLSKTTSRPDPVDRPIPLRQGPYGHSNPSLYDSQLTLNVLPESSKNIVTDSPEAPTVRIATKSVASLIHAESLSSNQSSDSTFPDAVKVNERPRQGDPVRADESRQQTTEITSKEPRLSWTVTLGTMVIVTIVSIFETPENPS